MLEFPEYVPSIEAPEGSIDTMVIVAECPMSRCPFEGEVEADVFLLTITAEARRFEYQWTCPTCGTEIVEYRDEALA